MNDRISLSKFAQLIGFAEKDYPDAKVVSIVTGFKNGDSYYVIFLECDGKEFTYRVPCYL